MDSEISNNIGLDDLTKVRLKNPNRILIGHININSLRNKFEILKESVIKKFDILLISETKLDDSFPAIQFCIEGFTAPYRLDRNKNGGGIILYIREDIPSKYLSEYKMKDGIENMFIEINLRSKKWLISGSYNPHLSNIKDHLVEIKNGLEFYSSKYENFIVLGDFNAEMENIHLSDFCALFNLKNLVKGPTCFKNLDRPTSIDHILTNRHRLFQNSGVYETGLSDFHKLTFTVLKMYFTKHKPRIIRYRDFKNFDNTSFRDDLLRELSNGDLQPNDFDRFKFLVINVLNSHAPMKEKHVRCNQSPFMNKEIRKAIMTRTRLLNIFRRNKSDLNRTAYKKQRNYCVNLLKNTKKNFYNNLNAAMITDNKQFWKTIKPNFTDKVLKDERITLVDREKIISDDSEVAATFNNYFGSIVEGLNISRPSICKEFRDPVLNAIKTFENHPSIVRIKNTVPQTESFSFECVSIDDIKKEILKLDVSKASQLLDIPTKLLKQNYDIFANFFHTNINEGIGVSLLFPDQLKYADVKPAFKKNSRSEKENYRPVSILSNISKIYERCLYKQLNNYFENILSKNQCGFRKGYSVVHCLLPMIEKFRLTLDKGGSFGALLTDLSKAFDCLHHELLIAKLHAYGLSMSSLKLIHSYLTKRKQRVKINDVYSSWTEILFGVPQGSILGPLLFNIYLCDLFMFITDFDIASYADDDTPYATEKDLSWKKAQIYY